jgi:hypothetical protein
MHPGFVTEIIMILEGRITLLNRICYYFLYQVD